MASRYTTLAIVLHWLVALIILFAFPLGLYMADLHLSPLKLKLFSWHKWAGVTVFLLVALRLAWRAGHPPPAEPAGMPAWQRKASAAIHHSLYLLMLAIPVTGWLMSSAEGVPTVYFGLWQLPDLLAKNKELGELLGDVHETLNWVMAGLVGIHVAAALKHHFIDKDDILARMLPLFGKS